MKSIKNQRFEDLPDVMTVAEASAVLRINKGAAYDLVHRGELAAVRIGRRMLIPKASLAQLLGVPAITATRQDRASDRHERQKKLTLRGSFVITVHLQSDDGVSS